ncbi:MAG: hypothetical protein K2O95_04750 [Clostridia bacterium]|nr:hypothetical protein [Clostridia bacterium]MDE7079408.1 hypothetical protein [Clostridia bacterium]
MFKRKSKEVNEKPVKKKIISTKQSWSWNYVCKYLEGIEEFNDVMDDEEFADLYYKLYDCAYEKILLHDDGDITEIYVVVDQEETGFDTENFQRRK